MKEGNGVMRYDVNDEADLRVLIENGLIWKGGARAWHAAIKYLRADPSAINDMVPPQVVEFLSAAPAGTTLPVEEPEVAPEPTEPADEAPAPETPGDAGVA